MVDTIDLQEAVPVGGVDAQAPPRGEVYRSRPADDLLDLHGIGDADRTIAIDIQLFIVGQRWRDSLDVDLVDSVKIRLRVVGVFVGRAGSAGVDGASVEVDKEVLLFAGNRAGHQIRGRNHPRLDAPGDGSAHRVGAIVAGAAGGPALVVESPHLLGFGGVRIVSDVQLVRLSVSVRVQKPDGAAICPQERGCQAR